MATKNSLGPSGQKQRTWLGANGREPAMTCSRWYGKRRQAGVARLRRKQWRIKKLIYEGAGQSSATAPKTFLLLLRQGTS